MHWFSWSPPLSQCIALLYKLSFIINTLPVQTWRETFTWEWREGHISTFDLRLVPVKLWATHLPNLASLALCYWWQWTVELRKSCSSLTFRRNMTASVLSNSNKIVKTSAIYLKNLYRNWHEYFYFSGITAFRKPIEHYICALSLVGSSL